MRSMRTAALATAVAVLAVTFGGPDPAAAAPPTISYLRTIGGPGHAELYGWGADTMSDGSVVISDYWNFRVRRFSTDGELLSTPVTNDGRHLAPYDVAVDRNTDTIYVGDVDQGRHVDKYSADGQYLGSLGSPGQFQYPAWLDVDATGRVAVVDSRLNKVAVFSASGALLYQFGSTGSGSLQFRTPRGVDFGPDGRLYVWDVNNRRVQIFTLGATSAARVATFPVSVPGDPRGLVVHPTRNEIYLAVGTGEIRRYSLTGQLLGQWGSLGSGPGQFIDGARALTVDGNGDIWAGDMPNFRAQKFSPTGTYLLEVPSTPAPPPPGGFNQPSAVAVDGTGDIFVSDTFNWRVQRLSADGGFEHQFGDRAVFNYARALALDPGTGAVVVGDTDHQTVEKYTRDGTRLWQTSRRGPVHSLAIGADGTVFAADATANVVRVFNGSNGNQIRTFGSGRLSNPRGVEVDADGTVWVSNQNTGRVVHFTATGSYLGQFGAQGQGPGRHGQAADVETDATRVYVADKSSHHIDVWEKNGTYLGSYGSFGSGPLQFRSPTGLHLTPGGSLYVIEYQGERVQELAVTG